MRNLPFCGPTVRATNFVFVTFLQYGNMLVYLNVPVLTTPYGFPMKLSVQMMLSTMKKTDADISIYLKN